jgi:hypothetical protein
MLRISLPALAVLFLLAGTAGAQYPWSPPRPDPLAPYRPTIPGLPGVGGATGAPRPWSPQLPDPMAPYRRTVPGVTGPFPGGIPAVPGVSQPFNPLDPMGRNTAPQFGRRFDILGNPVPQSGIGLGRMVGSPAHRSNPPTFPSTPIYRPPQREEEERDRWLRAARDAAHSAHLAHAATHFSPLVSKSDTQPAPSAWRPGATGSWFGRRWLVGIGAGIGGLFAAVFGLRKKPEQPR